MHRRRFLRPPDAPFVLFLRSFFLRSEIDADGSARPRFAEVKALAEACKLRQVEGSRGLLARHPAVLNSPDYDTRFFYLESCL